MSAKILQSMSEEDSAVKRHIGCMNGIFHLFNRHHFLQGRRRMGGHQSRLTAAAEKGRLDTQGANEALHISTMKNPKPSIDKQRLSTDSSRSSVSSSCNSSSFSSSIEDTKITLRSSERQCSTQQCPSEISKLVRDSILHRDVRGITVKHASKEESRALTYVDSPRPSLPSPKATTNTKRFSGIREWALPTACKLKNTSNSLLQNESPRYSYDESRSTTKIKEMPRYSLDSKRPNCGQLDRVVPSYTNQEPGIHRRQSSLVAKLMGLEDLEEDEKMSSIQNSRIIPMELGPWKRQELDGTQCLASQVIVPSVYGEMQNSKKIHEGRSKIETSSPTIKKTRSSKPNKKTEPAKVSASIVVPVPGLRRLDLGDKKLGGKKFLEEKRRGAEKTKNQHSPRKISATTSPRLQKTKKSSVLDSPRSKNSVRLVKKSKSHRDDQCCDLGGDPREVIEQNNGISLQSDGGIITSSSQKETEVTSEYRPKKMESVREDSLVGKRVICTVEQPSPVSVLDPRIYEDESPSPVRMISNHDESQWGPSPSSDATSINFIDTNPNRRFISEILFVPDSFKDLGSSSLMTKNSLLALEETKKNNNLEKRLIFDVVNEVLGRKVESYDRITSNYKLDTEQQLLKGLCKELDQLPCKLDEDDEDCFRSMLEKDLNHDSAGWTTCSGDITGVTVDIERMIFRELISEVLSIDSSVVRARGSGYRRQLF